MTRRYVEILPLPEVGDGSRLRVERDAREEDHPLIEVAIEQVLPEQMLNPDARHIRRGTVVTIAEGELGWVHERLGEVCALVDGSSADEMQPSDIARLVQAHRVFAPAMSTSAALVALADLARELIDATQALGRIEARVLADDAEERRSSAERRDRAERALAQALPRVAG